MAWYDGMTDEQIQTEIDKQTAGQVKMIEVPVDWLQRRQSAMAERQRCLSMIDAQRRRYEEISIDMACGRQTRATAVSKADAMSQVAQMIREMS